MESPCVKDNLCKDELDFEEEIAALEKEAYLQELIESSLSIARSDRSTNEKPGNDYFEVEIDEREYLHKDDIIKQKGGNSSYQPKHADHKYASKINLGNYEHPKLSQQKQNQAEAKERKQDGLFENRKKGKF